MVPHGISSEFKASPWALRAFVMAFPSWTSSPCTLLSSAVQLHGFAHTKCVSAVFANPPT